MRYLALVCCIAVAGCGGDTGTGTGGDGVPRSSPPAGVVPASARADLAALAAAAQDLVAVSFYALATAGEEDRTVMVVRAGDGSWRVDIPEVTVAGTAGGELFRCTTACVRVAALTGKADPRVHHLFTDWLDVFTDRGAALAVSATPPPAGVAGDCFQVQPSATSLEAPVDAGTYCYQADGTLTGAEFGPGTLTLTGTGELAPPTVDLPAPVVDRHPLPTASPIARPATPGA